MSRGGRAGPRSQTRSHASSVLVALLVAAALGPTAGRAEPMKIGLVPEQNIFRQLERYGVLRREIERRSGERIELVVSTSYRSTIDELRRGRLDGAFLGSLAAAVAIEELDLIPLARVDDLDGGLGYRGLLFVRRDSGIESIRQMAGKRLALVSELTTAGYLFPVAYLRERGVRDLRDLFADYYFAGSHDAAIEAVLSGRAEVGCAKSTVFVRFAREHPGAMEQLTVLASSEEVPSNGLFLRASVSAERRERIRTILLTLNEDVRGRSALDRLNASRFVRTDREEFAPVLLLARSARIALKDLLGEH